MSECPPRRGTRDVTRSGGFSGGPRCPDIGKWRAGSECGTGDLPQRYPGRGPIRISWHFEWLKERQPNPRPLLTQPLYQRHRSISIFSFLLSTVALGRLCPDGLPAAPPRDPRSSVADNAGLNLHPPRFSFTPSGFGTLAMKREKRKGEKRWGGGGAGGWGRREEASMWSIPAEILGEQLLCVWDTGLDWVSRQTAGLKRGFLLAASRRPQTPKFSSWQLPSFRVVGETQVTPTISDPRGLWTRLVDGVDWLPW